MRILLIGCLAFFFSACEVLYLPLDGSDRAAGGRAFEQNRALDWQENVNQELSRFAESASTKEGAMLYDFMLTAIADEHCPDYAMDFVEVKRRLAQQNIALAPMLYMAGQDDIAHMIGQYQRKEDAIFLKALVSAPGSVSARDTRRLCKKAWNAYGIAGSRIPLFLSNKAAMKAFNKAALNR